MRWRTFRAPRVPCKAKRYRAKDFFTCSILENSGKRGIRILLKKCRFGLPASYRPVSLQKLNNSFSLLRGLFESEILVPSVTIFLETKLALNLQLRLPQRFPTQEEAKIVSKYFFPELFLCE